MTAGWTDDRVGALKKLWLEGQSASQIAKQLGGGVTRNAVIGKVHRLGLSGRAAPSQPVRAPAPAFRTSRPRTAASTVAETVAEAAPAPVVRRLEVVQTPKPAEPVAAPSPAHVPDLPGTATVLTLGAHMCKWPIGDPSSREFSFCGRRASEGVYCIEHARVAYQPQVRRGGKDGASELARSLRRYI
ncbi:GcrA family cell cycle regulator [Brevundimonas sp. PAMC22021]|uniref:cell cycle sigma 70 cofactor GcrA n=1 Tax=Brevundimonas sp. PAMC22021 TaxID=2861285 RepID=UPI001C62A78E|nr:GcrA family cell cycle regulator [Brevundimonas sp. PAMC22021]QYF86478.1 GcrA family cell cycle regulator [Brevundimonas sp. PAMC22021]